MSWRQRQTRRGLVTTTLTTLTLSAACSSSHSLPGSLGETETKVSKTFQFEKNPGVDILFMVDNSPTMTGLQAKLAQAFPAFVTGLTDLPGGLPNVHIAVVSSDLGAGPTKPTMACQIGGDGGQFQSRPRANGGNCPTGLPPGATFLSSIDGVPNFTGTIADAFACIAQLGQTGCGFEHQFASVLRALEPGPTQPPGNQGFLRQNANLAIILITNEDDCSAPPDSPIFDATSRTVADPWGPLASFRCNEFGHLCNGMKPPRAPAVLQNCTSAEDGRLLRISEVVARTRALKSGDRGRILVAAVTGLPGSYEVFIPTDQDSAMFGYLPTGVPTIRHACINAKDHTFSDPAVRIKQWVDAFHGTLTSICDDSFAPAMTAIAAQVGGPSSFPWCWPGKLVDSDRTAPGLQPTCDVTDIATTGSRTPVPSCAKSPGALPCWEAADDPALCPAEAGLAQTLLTVKRPSSPQPGLTTEFTCSTCIPGVDNPSCRY